MTPTTPKAGFQTLWVQKQLAKAVRKASALKAQFIKATDLF